MAQFERVWPAVLPDTTYIYVSVTLFDFGVAVCTLVVFSGLSLFSVRAKRHIHALYLHLLLVSFILLIVGLALLTGSWF